MPTTTNPIDDAPQGAPKYNPLTAEHYAMVNKVHERNQHLEDGISRAHHIGMDVGAQAAKLERDKAVVARLLAMYPPPPKHPLAADVT